MKMLRLLLVSLVFFGCQSKNYQPGNTQKMKWMSLFNGRDLSNWTPKISGAALGQNYNNTFRVQDGILSTRYDRYDSFNNKFGALYFNQKFTNYRLRFEYRFVGNTAPGAPSWGFRDGGVQYHCQDPASLGLNQSFPVCLEYNLLGGNGTQERPTGEICASGMSVEIDGVTNTKFCTPPIVKRTFAGDVWVTGEIEVKDGTITHFVNGEQIIQFKNPLLSDTHPIAKTLISNGDKRVTNGYISIQSNSHPMDYRKIEIMEY